MCYKITSLLSKYKVSLNNNLFDEAYVLFEVIPYKRNRKGKRNNEEKQKMKERNFY